MKKIALSLVLASSMMLGAPSHLAEVTATIGGVKPEGNLDLEDQLSLGLRFGTYVEDKFFDMLEVGLERVNAADYENSSVDTNINRFFVNIIKEYDIAKDTSLYGLVGMGYENIRTPLFENDDDGFVQYGIGLKYWVNDNFALKAEARHGITFEGNNNLFYTLGFTIPLGKKAEPIPAPVVTTPQPQPQQAVTQMIVQEEPKPLVAVVVNEDHDNDGVPNVQDKCPQTQSNIVVGDDGCAKVIRLHVSFDFDKYEISSEQLAKIKEVADFMQANSHYTVALHGHTDAKGSEAYNEKLGAKRAEAVAKVLIRSGIAKERIVTKSFGETAPIFDNDTEEGRAQNRRVDANFNK